MPDSLSSLTYTCMSGRIKREKEVDNSVFILQEKWPPAHSIQPNIQAGQEKTTAYEWFHNSSTICNLRPPSHQQHAGKSRFLKPLPLDFLTMLSRKSDEISGDAQNQRHCQIFFSREQNCKRFYIFCSTPRHGQGLSLVVQFQVTVILLIKWEISQDTFTKYCYKIAKLQNYKIVTFRKQF